MFKRLWVVTLEMVLGLVFSGAGLYVLFAKPNMGEPAAMDRASTVLLTIGGIVFAAGIFRLVFANRVYKIQDQILSAIGEAREEFKGSFGGSQTHGLRRPQQQSMLYKYLYWRTQDKHRSRWLNFTELSWTTQVLPVVVSQAKIEQPDFTGDHQFVCTLVELQGSLAVMVTRIGHPEMSGLYFFPVPVHGKQLFGHLRHENMAGKQSLSCAIFSREKLDKLTEADLDRLWLSDESGGGVVPNLPISPFGQGQVRVA